MIIYCSSQSQRKSDNKICIQCAEKSTAFKQNNTSTRISLCGNEKTWDVWRNFGGILSITAKTESAGVLWTMLPWRHHTGQMNCDVDVITIGRVWRYNSENVHYFWWLVGLPLLLQTALLFVFTCWYMLELLRGLHSCLTQQCHRVGQKCWGRINAVPGNRRFVSIIVLICAPAGAGQLGERWKKNWCQRWPQSLIYQQK